MGATTKAEAPMEKKNVVKAAAADATKPTEVATFAMARALDALHFVDLISFSSCASFSSKSSRSCISVRRRRNPEVRKWLTFENRP